MQDQPLYLDASFDQRASYTLVAWLRPRDAYVNIGESLAIIQDGDMRRVVTAPCSGRVMTVYADAGARLLPRSLIATIRPGLPYTPQMNGISTTIIAVALIGTTIVLLPLLKTMIHFTRDTSALLPAPTIVVTPQQMPTDVALQPTSAPGTLPPPVDGVAPTATVGLPSQSGGNAAMVQRIHTLFIELFNLCTEIRPWAQRNMLLNPQIADSMIMPRSDRRNAIITELTNIINENSSMPNLDPRDLELLGQIPSLIQPCNTIFDEVLAANGNQSIPRDLSSEYDQCNAALIVTQQYLPQQ